MFNGIFSAVTTRALDTWKFFNGSVSFYSSNSEAAQNFRDEDDIKEAKTFGWIKEHALWGPNSQILATPAQSFPDAYARIPKPARKHWVENGGAPRWKVEYLQNLSNFDSQNYQLSLICIWKYHKVIVKRTSTLKL